ncbi:16S rRNA (guanine(966)-N(2))-methyltransferase RsmD [Benzoatithermus flavus]|uniref:16S rRNA (Guanine(966)-N(2))-methyltransferase RsmD n=1 Tax=Benzoatithermus flavus TaxID=3108223 RepID=A0ABU8XLS1_9PROT
MSLRIIAGRHRGRRIETPKGLATRPTSERAREALFNILEHGSPPLRGSRFLDLFAGSGAAGLEALSRGAVEALMIDQANAAVTTIRANIEVLGERERAKVLRADACRLGAAPHPFDIAFLDPPYGSGLLVPALEGLLTQGWLASEAAIVAEVAAREPVTPPPGFVILDERRYGAARFVFLRTTAESGRTRF